jgi:hypothetical protein
MIRLVLLGLALTALVTTLLWAGFGPPALVPGAVFGLLALGIQLLAVRSLKRQWGGTNAAFLQSVGLGMALRIGGVLVMLMAIVVDRGRFPPLCVHAAARRRTAAARAPC